MEQHAGVKQKTKPHYGVCVGCEEATSTVRVPELGGVCDSCLEVLDIVTDVVIERLDDATACVLAVVANLKTYTSTSS